MFKIYVEKVLAILDLYRKNKAFQNSLEGTESTTVVLTVVYEESKLSTE